ncbi:MAG: hypothetical protein AB7O67_01055 [Vicinamibacterales bacterium]
MTIDPGYLLLSLVVSGVGFVLFTYGRKQARLPQVVGGLLLMVYPYFASTWTGLLGGGALIAAVTWWVVRLGW